MPRGFHIQWRRKRGTGKWYVYTVIADRPIRSLKARIRTLTRRLSQQDFRTTPSSAAWSLP
jgi:RNA-directed DNA polymerase